VDEVRRDDGELCGYVARRGGSWVALTLFGGLLGTHDDEGDARTEVEGVGLAVLGERWALVDGESGSEEVVRILEAHPGRATVEVGYYPEPGAPTHTVTVDDLESGRWRLGRLG
jgi:hypothetical protein